MVSWLLLGLLILVSLAGIVLAAFQLPGAWVILAAAVGYDWRHGWQQIGWKWLIGLAATALLAEVFDSLASVIAARRAGASRRAAVGAILGGLAGMILLSIPIPVVGAIVGGLAGCFIGAAIAEVSVRDDLASGARVGLLAAVGRLVGLTAKTAAAVMMAGAVISLAILGLLGR